VNIIRFVEEGFEATNERKSGIAFTNAISAGFRPKALSPQKTAETPEKQAPRKS
jgi:hypothetical protein